VVNGLDKRIQFVLSENEQRWIVAHCPRLGFVGGNPPLRLAGPLDFDCTYAGPWAPDVAVRAAGLDCSIADAYNVEILLDHSPRAGSSLPLIRVTDDRIEKAMRKHGRSSMTDMHVSTDGYICLCTPIDEVLYFSGELGLEVYVSKLVIPFLYGQAFFERYGFLPWKERTHGATGILESYAEAAGNRASPSPQAVLDLLMRVNDRYFKPKLGMLRGPVPPDGGDLCICGSGKRFIDCHPAAYRGMLFLWRDLRASSASSQV
jgi:hypothetical protein